MLALSSLNSYNRILISTFNMGNFNIQQEDRKMNVYIHIELFGQTEGNIPDYMNDSDAIKNAEKAIKEKGYWQEYQQALSVLRGNDKLQGVEFSYTKAIAIGKMIKTMKEQNRCH